MILKKFLFIGLMFVLTPVFAKKVKSRKAKGRIVEVNFNDELLIKGKILGPSLFTLYQKRNIEFGKLIKPRKNFLPEMRVTLGDVE